MREVFKLYYFNTCGGKVCHIIINAWLQWEFQISSSSSTLLFSIKCSDNLLGFLGSCRWKKNLYYANKGKQPKDGQDWHKDWDELKNAE